MNDDEQMNNVEFFLQILGHANFDKDELFALFLDRVVKIVKLCFYANEHDSIDEKQWIIDQILRTTLPEVYVELIKTYEQNGGEKQTRNWSVGVPPSFIMGEEEEQV